MIPGRNVYSSKIRLPEAILQVAQTWANCRSKDPRTKVGAAAYDPVTGGIFLGYNGFPTGVPDTTTVWDRRTTPDDLTGKYAWVVHAERNAIRKAAMALGEDVSRCELYITHFPCLVCMRDWIVAFGIRRVFYADRYPPCEEAGIMARLCKVELHEIRCHTR